MEQTYPTTKQNTSRRQWERPLSTEKVHSFERTDFSQSEREFIRQNNIPRSTFRHWKHRKKQLCSANSAASFFETPEGLEVLHRIILAAQFVLTQLGGGGMGQVSTFLELSQLAQFVAPSYGSQQKVIKALEQKIVEFGQQETSRLAPKMPHRRLVLCLDETFHPTICLVAMDPRTGFIFVELYAQARDVETWRKAVEPLLETYNITIIQCVSDQATALQSLSQEVLKVNHGPDLFHIQQDLVKALSRAVSHHVKKKESALKEAKEEVEALVAEKEEYDARTEQQGRGRGRPPEYEKKLEKAREQEQMAQAALEEATTHQQKVKEGRHKVSDVYHPFDLDSGEPKTMEQLESQLNEPYALFDAIGSEVGLSDKKEKQLEKARRLIPNMVKTLGVFWQLVLCYVMELRLTPDEMTAFYRHLLVGYYFEKIAEQQKKAEKRQALREKSRQWLEPWKARDGPFATWSEERRKELEEVARDCAHWFVRASSCVEGRNGRLSWNHQSYRGLKPRKLAALTVVHNFFIQRDDGTSAAERLFGEKPKDLFEHLVEVMPHPRRPAAKRPRKAA